MVVAFFDDARVYYWAVTVGIWLIVYFGSYVGILLLTYLLIDDSYYELYHMDILYYRG